MVTILYHTALCAAALLSTVNAAPAPRASNPTGSIFIMGARGTNQPPGLGYTISTLASMIESDMSGRAMSNMSVNYPASMSDPDYNDSVNNGSTTLVNMIESTIEAHPHAQIVLLGYSQGAQVVGDAICGAGEGGAVQITAVNTKYIPNIKAVIWFGDPTHIVGEPFDVGTATQNGTWPRRTNSACTGYTSKIQSYCDYNDPYCASGNNATVHGTYLQDYGTQAAKFVVSQLS